MLRLFRIYFPSTVNLYETSYDYLRRKNSPEIFTYILSHTVDYKEASPQKSIIFYRPNFGKNTISRAESRIVINQPSSYILSLRSNSINYDEVAGVNYEFENEPDDAFKLMMLDEPTSMAIKPTDTLRFIFNTSLSNARDCEHFLEISKKGTLKKYRVPIIFRNILPKTSCIWLVIIYFISFLLVFTILFLLIEKTYENWWGRKMNPIERLLFNIPGSIWFFCSTSPLIREPEIIWWLIAILAFILTIYILVFLWIEHALEEEPDASYIKELKEGINRVEVDLKIKADASYIKELKEGINRVEVDLKIKADASAIEELKEGINRVEVDLKTKAVASKINELKESLKRVEGFIRTNTNDIKKLRDSFEKVEDVLDSIPNADNFEEFKDIIKKVEDVLK